MFPYFQGLCGQSKNLYNTTNFFIRQAYTALTQDKELQPLQQEVLDTLHYWIDKMNEAKLLAYEKKVAKELLKSADERKRVKPTYSPFQRRRVQW